MFSVLHKTDDGAQHLYSSVPSISMEDLSEARDGSRKAVIFSRAMLDFTPAAIESGRVFVMNEAGNTVARFYLSERKVETEHG